MSEGAQIDRLGLTLDRKTHITSEWSEFCAEMLGAASKVLTGNPSDAISSSVTASVKFISSVKLNLSPGERAYYLAVMSFAWAVSQIRQSEVNDLDTLAELKQVISRTSSFGAKDELFVPASFVLRPTSLPLYEWLRDKFLGRIATKVNAASCEQIRYKIDSAFAMGVFTVWAQRPDFYRSLSEALSSPAFAAADLALSWQAYRSHLVREFDIRPAFGQEESRISLSQLYIPIRATWPMPSKSGQFEFINLPRPENSHIGFLDDALDRWIDDRDQSDWFRLIGGGPGSGKSTTLKAFCRRLADREDRRPLFIPLQHIDLERDLRDSINNYFVQMTDSAFLQAPLSRVAVEDGAPLCLVFDGLDEIAAPGEAAREVVATFANKLSNMVAQLSGGGGRLIKVVLSGRIPAFQAAQKYLSPRAEAALETQGYAPRLRHDIDTNTTDFDDKWYLDQRPQWWAQYAVLVGLPVQTPNAFSSDRLNSITNEPLLCYLLALSGYAIEHWERAADNRNRIYDVLVDSVYERGWGDGVQKRQGAGRTLSRSDFNKLMETIALAAWLGGDARVATEAAFDRAITITGSRNAWATFTEENGPDVTNLAMNFYLKSSERDQRGFEFTHKSFGEYLAARALFGVATEAAVDAMRKPENGLRDWFRGCNTGLITKEFLIFLSDEIRMRISDDRAGIVRQNALQVKAAFQEFTKYVMRDGFPSDPSGMSWRSQEKLQLNAERALWAIMNACGSALQKTGSSENEYLVDLDWEDDNSLANVIARLQTRDSQESFLNCLSYLKATKQAILDLTIRGAEFEFSVFDDAVFARMGISDTSFNHARLTGARFYASRLDAVSFSNSDLSNVTAHACIFERCDFQIERAEGFAVGGLSILGLDYQTLDTLKPHVSLLTHSEDTKSEIEQIVRDRVEFIHSLPERKATNLVADWSELSSTEDMEEEDEELE